MPEDIVVRLTVQQTEDQLFVARVFEGNNLIGDKLFVNHGSFDEVIDLYRKLPGLYPGVAVRIQIVP